MNKSFTLKLKRYEIPWQYVPQYGSMYYKWENKLTSNPI